MARNPRPYIHRMFTAKRARVFRRLWQTYESHDAILHKLNAYPGPPVGHLEMRQWASWKGIKRPDGIAFVIIRRRFAKAESGITTAIEQCKRIAAAKKALPPMPKPKPAAKKPLINRQFHVGLSMGRPIRSDAHAKRSAAKARKKAKAAKTS